MAHTPGKWFVSETREGVVYSEMNGDIASLTVRVEMEENAHLISAAPELLEACKAVIAKTLKPEEWGQQVADAIAKAEGRI